MKHGFELSSRAEAELVAMGEKRRGALMKWIGKFVNGEKELGGTARELSTVPHRPRWWAVEYAKDEFVVLRGLSIEERRERGGIEPPRFLIRCFRGRADFDEEIRLLLEESGVRREAAKEAETEEQEEAAEALAKAAREAEEREAGNDGE
jgi:hypothetical protein